MGIFDKSNYIVYTGITEQFFQCTTKMILFAKMINYFCYKHIINPNTNTDNKIQYYY